MLDLESIAVDPTLAETGAWMNYMGARFLIARAGHAYDVRLVELYNENLDLIKSNTVEGNQKAIEIRQQAFAECILLGWEGVVNKDQTPNEYSPEKALKILRDPRFYELVAAIERFSNHHKNYQVHVEAEVAEDVKNTAAS